LWLEARVSSNPSYADLIHPDVERSWTLPASVYVDPAVLEFERQTIFSRTWQVVARRDQLAHAGDFVTANLLGETLLLARDQSGTLRGFYNVCRHRAGPPAEGCGNRRVFRCGYHGWTYSLEGKLLNSPEMEGACEFKYEEFGLLPVRAEEWGAWVFVNLDPQAKSLAETLFQLTQQSARYDLAKLKLYERREYHIECNWKVYIDNYLEGYHLPSVHPSLNRELDYGQYTTELHEVYSRQWSPIRGPQNESTTNRRYRQAEGDDVADYFWIFPNWMLNCYPDNISLNIVLPVGVERCVAIFEWYFPEGSTASSAVAETVRFSDEIQQEDGHICEVVFQNLKSRAYERGRFSAKQERGVHHFHRLYAQWAE
jgi:choline monooxygenase